MASQGNILRVPISQLARRFVTLKERAKRQWDGNLKYTPDDQEDAFLDQIFFEEFPQYDLVRTDEDFLNAFRFEAMRVILDPDREYVHTLFFHDDVSVLQAQARLKRSEEQARLRRARLSPGRRSKAPTPSDPQLSLFSE